MTAPDNLAEAVAQAFADEAARQENCPPANLSELSAEHRRMFLATIKVSILATLEGIMEPMSEMLWAHELPDIGPDEIRELWQAMLTTLLASMKDESHATG